MSLSEEVADGMVAKMDVFRCRSGQEGGKLYVILAELRFERLREMAGGGSVTNEAVWPVHLDISSTGSFPPYGS